MQMPSNVEPYTLDRVVRICVHLLIVAVVLWVVSATREVLIPLAVAFLLAYLLNPLVRVIEKRVNNRTGSVLITVFGAIALFLVAMVLVVPLIAGEVMNLGQLLRQAIGDESGVKKWATEYLPQNLAAEIEAFRNSEEFRSFVSSQQFETLVQSAHSISGFLFLVLRWSITQVWGVVSGLMSIATGLLGVFLILLYLVFLLIDYRAVEKSWKDYLPPQYRDDVVSFLSDFNDAMARYFRGQFLVAASVGVLFAIGFKIVGLKMAILLGLFVGALNMVPYLQIAGLIPAVLLAVLTAFEKQGSIGLYLGGVALVFVIVQAFQDAVLTPRIMGRATGLRPAMILFSVLFWGQLLGFLGLVLAIPLTCLGLAYYRRFLAHQNRGSAPSSSTLE